MWGGTGATEYKGWVAMLNQLLFLPVAYYLKVFAREVKLYRFVRDPDLGKIDITYTNYSFMQLEPMGLQCALMDLNHAIVKGMFECLHYFLSDMGVQKDLHDQGKRVNNSRGDGQDHDSCLDCFHYSDWDTIVDLFQYHNDAFQMPSGSPSSSILYAAGTGGPPGGGPPGGDPPGGGAPGHGCGPPGCGGGALGCGAPGCGGRSGGKGRTSPSGRTCCGLVAPKFGAGDVQHSSACTSQTETQQKFIYSYGTSLQKYQRMSELTRQCTGAKTFPPPPTLLCDNIQPIDIPHTHGLPIRSNLSHLGVMLKVHSIRTLELTPLPPPEQVKRTPMKSHMAPVPQTSSMKRSRDDSDSSEDSSIDVDTPNLLLHNLKANVKVLEAYEAYQREQKMWKRVHSEATRKLSSMVQSQPSPDQSSASGSQPLASGSGEYWARPSGDFFTHQLIQISMERARRYAEAQLSGDDNDDDNGSLPPSVFHTPPSTTALLTLTPPHSVPSTTPQHRFLPVSAHKVVSPASKALFSTPSTTSTTTVLTTAITAPITAVTTVPSTTA